jgi:hypothetical protein
LRGAEAVAVAVDDIVEWAEGAYAETVDRLNGDLDAADYWSRTGDAANPRDLKHVLPSDPDDEFDKLDQEGLLKAANGEQETSSDTPGINKKVLEHPREISLVEILARQENALIKHMQYGSLKS